MSVEVVVLEKKSSRQEKEQKLGKQKEEYLRKTIIEVLSKGILNVREVGIIAKVAEPGDGACPCREDCGCKQACPCDSKCGDYTEKTIEGEVE